ncbi:nucleotide disphospho-sugar-binding domain-containing protein [Actinokineospora sp. NPDC004072]
MRFVFSTVGLPGHFFPLVPLAWAVRAAGHEVLVMAPDDFVPTVVRAGLPAAPVGDAVALSAAGEAHGEPGSRRGTLGRAFARMARRVLPGTQTIVNAWQPDLVVSERAEYACRVAAAAAGVPHAELHWGVAPLRGYQSAATAELRAELTALGLAGLPEPAMVINPWPPSLRLGYAAAHHGVRNVNYNGDARVPDWVWQPRTRPRICVTLGTVLPKLGARRLREVVVPMLEDLSRLDVDLAVAMDPAVTEGWPTLPDAVRHLGRMPLSQVLGACDVVVHHGGHGTSLTAFHTGCPQLVLPELDDQFDNADAVVRSGAGLRLLPADATPAAVTAGCAELLSTPRFATAAAAVAAEIAAQPPLVDIVTELTAVAERGTATAA